mmetsp:Transcript_21375/g.33059  ORF Transcript_21375/g.33059 Transcript_21375/m.33059 type:complete len:189 (+) Transcript_21375:154-720(+)
MVAQNTSKNSPAAIAALTCNETDALIQVKYSITKDEWDSSWKESWKDPFLYLQGIRMIPYVKFADLTDYETCLPRDECTGVVVGGLPTDAYEISFDGKPSISAKSFSSMARTLSPQLKWVLAPSLPSAKIQRLSWMSSIGVETFTIINTLFVLRTKMATLCYTVSQRGDTLFTNCLLVYQKMMHATRS